MRSQMSKQYQTTIPSKIRKQLGVNPGNRLNWDIVKDELGVEYATVIPETKNTLKPLKGVFEEMYKNNKDYLKKERESWD